jgi:hypothetical protein
MEVPAVDSTLLGVATLVVGYVIPRVQHAKELVTSDIPLVRKFQEEAAWRGWGHQSSVSGC